MPKHYIVKKTEELALLTQEINNLQVRINDKRSLRPERWETVMEKLKMEWTYDYCSITPLDLTLRSDKLAEFSSRYASNMVRLPGP
jgi:hypothetical protein